MVSAVGYRTPAPDHPVHYGLPSPWLTVIFSLDDGVESASDLLIAACGPAAADHRRRSAHAVQLRWRPGPGRPASSSPSTPGGAGAARGAGPRASSTDYDGRQVLDRHATRTQEQLTECRDWDHAFAVLGRHLSRSLDRTHRVDPRSEVRHAWSLLQDSGGRLPIAEVAARVGLSPRHLGTLFTREVGRTPKAVAQLMRFQGAVGLIKVDIARTGRTDLAAVAARCGYADQSHLTHDFVERLGVPPTRWISEEFRNLQDHGAPPAA